MSLDECEILRRGIGKKDEAVINECKDKIYKTCKINKHPNEVADLLWSIAENSIGYLFNRSHAVAYASLAAASIYIKINHPKEFFLALLRMAKNEPDPQECIAEIYR